MSLTFPLRRSLVVVIITIAFAAILALLSPAPSAAAQDHFRRAAVICQNGGGTFTKPGGNEIFACALPSPVLEGRFFDSLLHQCFGPLRGLTFGPRQGDLNTLVCLLRDL